MKIKFMKFYTTVRIDAKEISIADQAYYIMEFVNNIMFKITSKRTGDTVYTGFSNCVWFQPMEVLEEDKSKKK